MSGTVVVVGPKAVLGPGVVDPESEAAALECIDDDLALVAEQVVSVDDLWREVLGSATTGSCCDLTLLCPSWWPDARVQRVVTAATRWGVDPVVLRRDQVPTGAGAVVELASELVVVRAGSQRHVFARGHPAAEVIDAVVASVEGLPALTVDVPAGFELLGADVARALRQGGIEVTVADDHALVDAVRGSRVDGTGRWRRVTPRVAAVAVATLTASALAAAAAVGLDPHPDTSVEGAWLVEGRVAVEVPVGWTVERITSGPGSARVLVTSPTDRFEAIHVTQSRVPDTQTLEATAEALRAALAEQPAGVFVDFTAASARAERAAVTYRELRADRHVDWTVVVDGGVRIAIGCQGSPGGPAPRQPCDRAVRSAHAVRRN